MADLASTRVFGKLTVVHDAILRANAEIAGNTHVAGNAEIVGDMQVAGNVHMTSSQPEMHLETTLDDATGGGRVRFSSAIDDTQGIQLRYSWHNSESNPYGLILEEDSSNTLKSGANFHITGIYYGNGSGLTNVDADTVDGKHASDFVPIDRTVNGKPLSENITLSASDVGALASGSVAFDSNKLGGFGVDINTWPNVPHVRSDGVMDVGRFVDFHTVSGDTNDYSVRLTGDAGNLICSGNVTAYSDVRLKRDIKRIERALDKVGRLSGYTFSRIDNDAGRQTGVIAQEVLEVLPEAVTGGPTENDPDGHYSVAYGNLVGLLIEAIKEERSAREALGERLEKLMAEVRHG